MTKKLSATPFLSLRKWANVARRYPQCVAHLVENTVWIIPDCVSGWQAINHLGVTVARAKFKATLEFTLREMAANPDNGFSAIAIVVAPHNRHPHRKPNTPNKTYHRLHPRSTYNG